MVKNPSQIGSKIHYNIGKKSRKLPQKYSIGTDQNTPEITEVIILTKKPSATSKLQYNIDQKS